MQITTEETPDGVTIVRLAGDMSLFAHQGVADRLRDVVGVAISLGRRQVILSLADVTRIDSRGIGAIARCEAAAITQRAEILLVLGPGQVMDSLVRLNFIQVCQVFPDEASALQSFAARNAQA
jgi:anti-sigma B factor antagonist